MNRIVAPFNVGDDAVCTADNDNTNLLIDLVEDFLGKMDEEMEHGQYGAPDTVPPEYDDEENYYARHDDIVNKAVEARTKIVKFIDAFRKKAV